MEPVRICVFMHVPYEGPGIIENWATNNGFPLSYTRFYCNDPIPVSEDFDWLVVMGGPMSVNDESGYLWLKAEKQIIQQAVSDNKTVIGICLGAQLLASVLGGQVFPNNKKEIGWFPVYLNDNAPESFLLKDLPGKFITFHWHGDTFQLPEGAVHLAFSKACQNQAFLIGNKVLGLQFHPEATPESLEAMLKNGRHELIVDEYIQSEKQIRDRVEHYQTNHNILTTLLDRMAVAGVGEQKIK